MDTRYHTVRMDRAPQVGEIFASSLLDPAPAPDKWWKVMFSPAPMVSGGFAVTLRECDPKPPEKGPVGDKVHALLRVAPPPEPSPKPVMRITVESGCCMKVAGMHSTGLPDGEHDLYAADQLANVRPQPTLATIYAEVMALRELVKKSGRAWSPAEQMRVAAEINAKWGCLDAEFLRADIPEQTGGPLAVEASHTCVFEFAEDRVPTFRDGPASSQHELETVVDAKRCTTLVRLVDDLRQENKKLSERLLDAGV